ncbi:MAG: hypothetical protein NTY93_01280 [Candidatus Kaiserbacteria bacterium]|nr:hypothetical protein [Candidatus Kaiserbacteria bacterium]
MEGFRVASQIQQKGVEKMPDIERKRELGEEIKNLHDYFEKVIKRIWKEKEMIRDKYEDAIEKEESPWTLKPDEFMSAQDAEEYQKLTQKEADFEHKVNEATRISLDLLSKDETANWQRQPPIGVPGSLSETNSREYRSKIDDTYDLKIGWCNYPDDDRFAPESFRESYSAGIVGSRDSMVRKGFGGIGKKIEKQKFPTNVLGIVQIEQNEQKFKPSEELKNEFDEITRARFQEELLELGERLHKQLG